MSLQDKIQALSDRAAVRILNALSSPADESHMPAMELTHDTVGSLAEQMNIGPIHGQVNEGELARRALLFLVAENKMLEEIERLIESLPAQKYMDPVSAALTITTIMMVLKTSFEIQKDKNGKITWKIKSPGLNMKVLRDFISTLSGWFSGRS